MTAPLPGLAVFDLAGTTMVDDGTVAAVFKQVLASEGMDLAPEQLARVLAVGDTALDLQAGTAAGAAWVVGVLSGAHDRARLLQNPHTHLLGSVADLPELLG